ncbi:MAG: hypothetical protein QOD06_107 [Candidatus Binatota bacterium]|nr:hypothetical protein [Candidatus Binatota bacterium]
MTFVLLALLLAAQVSPWWMPTPDAAMFLSVARSVAGGDGLRAFGEARLGHPPGYALLIAPAFWLGERPFLAIAILHWILAVLLMIGVHRWARRFAPEGALLLAALVMVNVSLWIHFRRTLAELAFMTGSVWTVEAMNRVFSARGRPEAARSGVAAALLLAVTTLVRETGVLLAVGFVIAAAVRATRSGATNRWRVPAAAIVLLAVGSAVAVTFTMRERATGVGLQGVVGTHLDGLLDPRIPLGPRVAEGLRLRTSEVGRLLVPGMFKAYGDRWFDWNTALYVPLAMLIAAGWWRLVRCWPDPWAFALPFHFAAYSVWGFDAGTRYLLPVLPVLWAAVWFLLPRRPRVPILSALLTAHVAVSIGYTLTREIPRARACDRDWPAVDRLAEGLRGAEGRIVLSDLPECTGLMLVFALDRHVPATSPDRRRDADWIVDRPEAPIPPGFVMRERAGAYRLLARQSF